MTPREVQGALRCASEQIGGMIGESVVTHDRVLDRTAQRQCGAIRSRAQAGAAVLLAHPQTRQVVASEVTRAAAGAQPLRAESPTGACAGRGADELRAVRQAIDVHRGVVPACRYALVTRGAALCEAE